MKIKTLEITVTFELQHIDDNLLENVAESLTQGDLEGTVAYMEDNPSLEIKVISKNED